MPLLLPSQSELKNHIESGDFVKLNEVSQYISKQTDKIDLVLKKKISQSTIGYINYSRDYLSNLPENKSKQIAELDAGEQALKNAFGDKNTCTTKLKTSLIELNNPLNAVIGLINALSKLNADIATTQSDLSQFKGLEKATRVTLEVVEGEVARAIREQYEKNNSHKKLQDDNKALKAQLSKTHQSLDKLNTRISILEESISQVSKSNISETDDRKELNSTQLEMLKKDLLEKSQARAFEQAALTRAESLLQHNESKLEPAKQSWHSSKELVKKLNDDKVKLKSRADDYKQQSNDLQKSLSHKEQERAAKSNKLDRITDIIIVNLSYVNTANLDKLASEDNYSKLVTSVYNLAYSYSPYSYEVAGNAVVGAVSYAASYLPSMPSWSVRSSLVVTNAQAAEETRSPSNDSMSSMPDLTPISPVTPGVHHINPSVVGEQVIVNHENEVIKSDGFDDGTANVSRTPGYF